MKMSTGDREILEDRKYYLITPGKTSTSAVELLCLTRPSKITLSKDQAIAAIKHSKSAKVELKIPNTIMGHSTCVTVPSVVSKKEVLTILESSNKKKPASKKMR
ncbi:MAG: hypothetical protein RBR26_10600 [Methanosarcina mazei]|nr:hypothetical protein [Methanosarcina mazei]